MTELDHVELVPARPTFLAVGWVSLSTHSVGFLVALAFARRRVLTLVLFGAFTLVGAVVSFTGHRYALRRVSVPPPPGAVRVPARFPIGSAVAAGGGTAVIVAVSVLGNLSASILGLGFGSSFATLWAAAKLGDFERDHGRRVMRRVGPRFGGNPGLYADP